MAFRFGDFVLDRDTRQLLFRQEEVHLSPKAFDLLRILLVNRPRVVSRADLQQQQLWPSTFVEESNIAGFVADVRAALRDPASDPKFGVRLGAVVMTFRLAFSEGPTETVTIRTSR